MLITCIVLAKVQYVSPYRTSEFFIENGIDKEHESKKWHYKKAVKRWVFLHVKNKMPAYSSVYICFCSHECCTVVCIWLKGNRRLTSFSRKLWSRLPSCKIKSGRKRRRIKNKILIVKTRMMIKNANKTVNCYFTLNQSAISSRNDSWTDDENVRWSGAKRNSIS